MFSERSSVGVLGGRSQGRRAQKRALQPGAEGSALVSLLEPRVVMTVIAGPFSVPQDGASATLTEVNGQMQAHVSLACNAAPVKVFYESFSNATVYPTTAGLHNNGKQVEQGLQSTVLLPGTCTTLSLPEGLKGIAADGQITGTQFDVFIDPLCDIWGDEEVNVAAAIAYLDSSSTGWKC